MTCATCGATVNGAARFCASCGAPTAAPARSASPAAGAPKSAVVVAKVDPLAMTAPDAFAETANADSRAHLERALAEYDAKKAADSRHVDTNLGVGGPAQPVATAEMPMISSASASPPVSPKAASHVIPPQQPRTAAMPASAHRIPAAQPSAPTAPASAPGLGQAPAGSSPHARAPQPAMTPPPGALPAVTPPAATSAPHPPAPLPFPSYARTPPPLAPGVPVSVTWANGQRYRGTVVQLMGTRVLVVFPDGQQHWVEASYVSAV